ncbi:hypothetical protein Lche_2352 [Legionella cherrii]|uniref:Uncharacterized protein n=1 Tax=Legionella cherrii TaxID=28084 RepID=A0A0W0S9Q6_9GAMM|nr:hypothetical protein Lche_2352 [Legionella cherrii]
MRTIKGIIKTAMEAIFISKGSIFLPRYSGVLPTISPAINTVRITSINIPYSPEPTPPKLTSPKCIIHKGTNPPRGVNESSMEFTEPLEAAVVAVVQIAELTIPKRVSLPSILPAG